MHLVDNQESNPVVGLQGAKPLARGNGVSRETLPFSCTRSIMRKTFVQTVIYKKHLFLQLALLLVLAVAAPLVFFNRQHQQEELQRARTSFITSIDTMKESKDTDYSTQLTDEQIANDIYLCASLNPKYITVDTHYNKDTYLSRWVRAIRTTGKHVWFRPSFRGWGTGVNGIMTPTMYLSRLRTFILTHPGLFQPGDIFDENAEPENGQYWGATYGANWSSQAPNQATDDFNSFLVGLTDTADQAFQHLAIRGV